MTGQRSDLDPPPISDEDLAAIKQGAIDKTITAHDGVFPDGFRFYFRRYGKYGGRWRGVDPHGCWVESNSQELAERSLWWLVWCFESDEKAKGAA